MAAIIDSSVIIAAERGQLDLAQLLRDHGGETIAIAAITASELLHGVHRAARPAQRIRREAFVEHVLTALPVVPFDLIVARTHAHLWAQLAAKGTVIGSHDLLIAATALSMGYDVATRDERSFPKIPGLTVLRW